MIPSSCQFASSCGKRIFLMLMLSCLVALQVEAKLFARIISDQKILSDIRTLSVVTAKSSNPGGQAIRWNLMSGPALELTSRKVRLQRPDKIILDVAIASKKTGVGYDQYLACQFRLNYVMPFPNEWRIDSIEQPDCSYSTFSGSGKHNEVLVEEQFPMNGSNSPFVRDFDLPMNANVTFTVVAKGQGLLAGDDVIVEVFETRGASFVGIIPAANTGRTNGTFLMSNVPLKPGTHRIRVTNPGRKKDVSVLVKVTQYN